LELASEAAPDLAFGIALGLALCGIAFGSAPDVAGLDSKLGFASDAEVRFARNCERTLALGSTSSSAFVLPAAANRPAEAGVPAMTFALASA